MKYLVFLDPCFAIHIKCICGCYEQRAASGIWYSLFQYNRKLWFLALAMCKKSKIFQLQSSWITTLLVWTSKFYGRKWWKLSIAPRVRLISWNFFSKFICHRNYLKKIITDATCPYDQIEDEDEEIITWWWSFRRSPLCIRYERISISLSMG